MPYISLGLLIRLKIMFPALYTRTLTKIEGMFCLNGFIENRKVCWSACGENLSVNELCWLHITLYHIMRGLIMIAVMHE